MAHRSHRTPKQRGDRGTHPADAGVADRPRQAAKQRAAADEALGVQSN